MEQAIQAANLRVKAIAPLVDSSGRQLISDSLRGTSGDPLQCIAPLQHRLSYNLPASECALEFLAAMESDHTSISVSIFESLSSHLESLVGSLSQAGLEDLLRETIPYISIKELKAIPISIMKTMKIIPSEYLIELIASDTLSNFPIDVRRQAWQTEKGKNHYIKTIDDILSEGGDVSTAGGGVAGAHTNPAVLEAKRVEMHAKSISDMIMHSKRLFDAFADYCSERTITLYLEKCAALAAAAAKKDRGSDVSSQSSVEPAVAAREGTAAVVVAPSRNAKYNYAALLQRALMALQEANRKVKFCEALHDFATLLDRGKRSNSLDSAAVKSLFDTFKRMYTACLTTHQKHWKELEEAYWLPRGGKPVSAKEKKSIAQHSSSSSKAKPARSAGASKASKAKTSKSAKRSFIQDDEEEVEVDSNSESEEDGDGDGLSDTEHASSARSGSVKRARLSKGSAPRKRVRKAEVSDESNEDSGGEGHRKEKVIELAVLEPLIQEALEHLLSFDSDNTFSMEVTDAIAPGYSTEIKAPMDFTKMQRKLDAHQYRSLKQFDSDIQLMVRNCRKYNGISSPFTKIAQFLQREWARRWDDFKDRLAYGTEQQPVQTLKKSAADSAAQKPKPKKATPAAAPPQAASAGTGGVRPLSASVRAAMDRLLQQMKDLDSDLSTGELVRSVLNLAWEYLTLADEKKTFAQPVSDRIAPGYSRIIKKKMALSNMKTKIYRGDYSTIEDFQEDVQLIVDNCRKFNAGAEEYVMQAMSFMLEWQKFYKEASAQWPAVTAREQTGALEDSDDEEDESTSESAGAAVPTSLVLNAQAGIKVKIPPEGHGRYLKENDNIELPHILTAEQVRGLVAGKDPQSQAALRSIMAAAWNYLTELDEEGIFAAPVMLLDYLKTITSPMDLGTIKLKMDRRKYKTIAEFNTDVTLMLHNCLTYNEEGSEVSVWAEYLLFGWYMCKQNIESVLRGDPSLAVELLPPHTIGSNDDDGGSGQEQTPGKEQEVVVPAKNEKAVAAPVLAVSPAVQPTAAADATKDSAGSTVEVTAVKRIKKNNKKIIEDDEEEMEEEPLTIKLRVGAPKVPAVVETVTTTAAPAEEKGPVKVEEVKVEMKKEMDMKVAVEEVEVEKKKEMKMEVETPLHSAVSEESHAMDVADDTLATTTSIADNFPAPIVAQAAALSSADVVSEATPFAPVGKPASPVPQPSDANAVVIESEGKQVVSESPSDSADSPVVVKASSRRPVYPSSSSPASSSQSQEAPVVLSRNVSLLKDTVAFASAQTTSTPVPVVEATELVESSEPTMSEMLVSLESARTAIETPRYLLSGRMVYELSGTWSSADLIPLHHVDLPYVLADAQLRWALALLRDFSVQALLRRQFAMSLRDLIVKSSDVRDINQAKADAANTIGHFANKVYFPHGSATCRQLFQLCQMSLTYADRIDGLDEHVLRVYIPLLVYHTVKPSAEATNPPAAAISPPATATTAERAQMLNTTARALVKNVLEHTVSDGDNIFKRSGYSSCFSERAVLREFLESVAKHLINMKLKG